MDLASYRLHVDWNNTGTFAGPYDDVSAYLMSWNCASGNDTGQIGAKAGALSAKLDNASSIFSSFNSSSPIYGKILPGIKVRMQMQIGAGSWVTLWQGYLDNLLPTVGMPQPVSTATLTAYGVLQSFTSEEGLDIAMMEDATTGAAINAILDAAGFPAGDRSIDTGQSTMSRFWARNGKTLELLRQLEATEVGLIREAKDGKVVFEDRAHRLNAPHTTPRSTYGTGTLRPWDLQQLDPLQDIYNHIEVNVRTFNISDSVVLATVTDLVNGQGGAPIPIGVGETKVIDVLFPSSAVPAQYLAVYQWGIIDANVNTQTDMGGSDLTNLCAYSQTSTSRKMSITITNNSGQSGYIVILRVHGIAIIETDPLVIKDDDTASQTKYKKRSYPSPSEWLTHEQEARDYCDHILAIYSGMRRALRFKIKANFDMTHLLEAQTIDISDRIHITANLGTFGLGIDSDFFVEWVKHTVNEGRIHEVEVYCREIVTHVWAASGTPYIPKVIPSSGNKVPDDLQTFAFPNGLTLAAGCIAEKYNDGIYEAEFRAEYYAPGTRPKSVDLRLVSEGGTFVPNGTSKLSLAGLAASDRAINYVWTSLSQGSWFYVFRLKNLTGWSVWSDGNDLPKWVVDYVDTEDPSLMDDGPPANWGLTIESGPIADSVVVRASRPLEHGRRILFVAFQVKDLTTGSPVGSDWRLPDDNVAPAVTKYDGSGADHTFDKAAGTITQNASPRPGYGSAAAGDMLMFDVRGDGLYDSHYCNWIVIPTGGIAGGVISGMQNFSVKLGGDPTKVRVRIVTPPWEWSSGGFFGAYSGNGYVDVQYWLVVNADGTSGDLTTQEFISPPILVPTGTPLENLGATVYFENAFSRSNDDRYTVPVPVGSSASTSYEVILTDAATIAIDARLSDTRPRKVYFCQLTDAVGATRVLGNPSDAKHRQPMIVILKQSATGGKGYSLGTKYRLNNIIALDSHLEANKQDYIGIMYDGYADKFDVISFVPNYGG
jgi:hypothetical protein